MKKVLFLIDSLRGGGAEKVLVDIVENLDKCKFDITVMTCVREGVYVENIKKHVKYKPFFIDIEQKNNIFNQIVDKIYVKLRSLFLKFVPAKIIHKLFIGNKYDVEIAFLEGHATKIIGSSMNKKSKKYAWVHTDMIANNWSRTFYKSLDEQIDTYNKFNSIYCVSEQAKNSVIDLTQRNENVFTFYNPVNKTKIRELATTNHVDFNPNIFNIITVGRLHPQKGYDRLLNVHKRLINEGIIHHLYILGEGKERDNLESFISENSLESTVNLLGFQTNPYVYMNSANLFVCSSRAEGYSLVVAESLILGVPVISTNCAGPCELLGFGEYGLITDNTEDSLYEGLKKMITDVEMYESYKNKCLQRGKYFDSLQPIDSLVKILEG